MCKATRGDLGSEFVRGTGCGAAAGHLPPPLPRTMSGSGNLGAQEQNEAPWETVGGWTVGTVGRGGSGCWPAQREALPGSSGDGSVSGWAHGVRNGHFNDQPRTHDQSELGAGVQGESWHGTGANVLWDAQQQFRAAWEQHSMLYKMGRWAGLGDGRVYPTFHEMHRNIVPWSSGGGWQGSGGGWRSSAGWQGSGGGWQGSASAGGPRSAAWDNAFDNSGRDGRCADALGGRWPGPVDPRAAPGSTAGAGRRRSPREGLGWPGAPAPAGLRLVVLVGLPGCGKSWLAARRFAPAGWDVVSQDQLGSRRRCEAAASAALLAGVCPVPPRRSAATPCPLREEWRAKRAGLTDATPPSY